MKQYCITIDFWTETYTKIGYGGIAIHYFDNKFGLNTFVLCCKAYKLPSQYANNIRLFTENELQSFSLEIKNNTYIVCDNENKMRAPFRHNAVRIGCSAHFLNKIIEHALTLPTIGCDDIQKTFNSVHDLVQHLRRSHVQSKLSKRLQIFSKTRWNSVNIIEFIFINVPNHKYFIVILYFIVSFYRAISMLKHFFLCIILGVFNDSQFYQRLS